MKIEDEDSCNITQGFVHTPPLPPDELLHWTTGVWHNCPGAIWRCTLTFGNLAFTHRGVEQLGSSLGS